VVIVDLGESLVRVIRVRSELLGEIDEVRKDELKRKKGKEKERLFLHATCESVWIITYPYRTGGSS
jgi:hypothetical protein